MLSKLYFRRNLMLRIAAIVLCCGCSADSCAQTLLGRLQKFQKDIPPGNYSGITPIGNNRYAVVSDKDNTEGFHVFHIEIDTLKRRVLTIDDEGFRSSSVKNRDMEGITFHPASKTVFISGESDNEAYECSLDGKRTGRQLQMPQIFKKARNNRGLESLTYDSFSRRFFTTTEMPLTGDSVLRIQSFNDDLSPSTQYLYKPDAPFAKKCIWGVSELCAPGDGSLLVLERQMRIPKLKIGSKALVRIYRVVPEGQTVLKKYLMAEFTTKLNLTRQNFANFEGMCMVAPGWLLLIADSQNRFKGILRDWFRLVKIDSSYEQK